MGNMPFGKFNPTLQEAAEVLLESLLDSEDVSEYLDQQCRLQLGRDKTRAEDEREQDDWWNARTAALNDLLDQVRALNTGKWIARPATSRWTSWNELSGGQRVTIRRKYPALSEEWYLRHCFLIRQDGEIDGRMKDPLPVS